MRGIAKIKAEAGHEVYALTPEQVAAWKKAAAPLQAAWADDVRKAGGDPDAVMKELQRRARQVQRGGEVEELPSLRGGAKARRSNLDAASIRRRRSEIASLRSQ